ncbi:MAG: hypothetical protein LQ343_005621 [Gyalolechia ehrenbergii]|nr:MAG: hypothetical protein LQ343_005621 [Gyalolechia ehrenbergii]
MDTAQERVIVPSHTPKPLPDYLRAELTSTLLSTSAIPVIQSTLYNASRDAGWTDSVRERAKQLLNNGQQPSWQELLDLLVKESHPNTQGRKGTPGGLRRVSQQGDRVPGNAEATDNLVGIRFPNQAVMEGKEAIKQALEDIVEIEGTNAVR